MCTTEIGSATKNLDIISVENCIYVPFIESEFFTEDGRIEITNVLPFDIKRVYYLYNIDPAIERGNHAHKTLNQLLIALSGKISIEVSDGSKVKMFELIKPTEGLYIPKLIWKRITFSSRSDILLVIASGEYDEFDYIRDYDDYRRFAVGIAGKE